MASAATARSIRPHLEALPNQGLASGAPLREISRGQVPGQRIFRQPDKKIPSDNSLHPVINHGFDSMLFAG